MSADDWATDTPISMPEPPDIVRTRAIAPGFAYTRFGLTFDLDRSDLEDYLFPTYLPFDHEG